MTYLETKILLEKIINNDYEKFIKALISLEKDIDNPKLLDNLYQQYICTDNMSLLNTDFDYLIDNLS